MGGAHHDGAAVANHGRPVPMFDDGLAVPRYPAGSGTGAPVAPLPLSGHVALVSGGSQGLGLRIVRMLAERGMRVVLASRSAHRGRAAVELLGDLADRVAVRELDIRDPGSVARLASWLDRRLGRCDVLVNNAAVLIDDDRDGVATVDLEVVRSTLETNLLGTWRLTQAIVPLMYARRYGRIVNVSSGLASLAGMRRGLPAYRASKCAVNALTRMLADELASAGILVNACCPGPVHGDPNGARLSASADAPVWLATLPDDGPTGGFYRGRTPLDW
ncbi:SDR family NAD(P)-dependent oxidoreductase [Phytohabitans kaempferiae]|uniref:SDR family NAD(P)-dependent oxidoreductase n=1 Tax=Phytohabitans kaempferiae TaxID=1620943 RepID=A0ABV6LYP8_9ACTN